MNDLNKALADIAAIRIQDDAGVPSFAATDR